MAGDLDLSLFAVFGLPIYSILMYCVLYRYVEPRDGCKSKLILCLVVSICLQILIRVCLLSDNPWIVELNVGKLLTIFMVILLMFWGGSLIQGGWVRIGLYLILTEIIFSISSRVYWQVWGIITHASTQDIVMHARVVALDRATGIQLLVDSGIALLLLIPASKLRKLPIRPLRPAQIIVIAYLAYGCMPTTSRTGFDGGNIIPMFVGLLGFAVFVFLVFISIMNTAERNEHQMLELKQRALSELAQSIYYQKRTVRRFRHDVRKHLDTLEYLLQNSPNLSEDKAFLLYQQEFKAYENVFRQAYYCGSDEVNTGLAQIDQYCRMHDIPVTIQLKRLRFPGWKQEDQLVFGMLLYQGILTFAENGVTKLRISGDCLQGQNMMRVEIGCEPTCISVVPGVATLEDVRRMLLRYGGSALTEQTDDGYVCLLQWNDGEEECLSTQYC